MGDQFGKLPSMITSRRKMLHCSITRDQAGDEAPPKAQEEKEKLKKYLHCLGSLSKKIFPVWRNLSNREVLDVLCQHLETRAEKLRYWCGSSSLKHQPHSSINKPGPDRMLTFADKLSLVKKLVSCLFVGLVY